LEKDVIVALFGASVGLAGILLVFVGFVYSRGEQLEPRRKRRYSRIAQIGLLPFLLAVLCAWLCSAWLTGSVAVYDSCVYLFRAALALTAIYGFVALLADL
jgi:hypothetical protein